MVTLLETRQGVEGVDGNRGVSVDCAGSCNAFSLSRTLEMKVSQDDFGSVPWSGL